VNFENLILDNGKPDHKNHSEHQMKKIACSLILLLTLTTGLTAIAKTSVEEPIVERGVMNFQNWSLINDGRVKLDGEWEFYWHQLFVPDDFKARSDLAQPRYIQAPGYWDNYIIDGNPLGGAGFATFRLVLKNLEPNQLIALDIPLMHTAYILWANGRIISSNGVVGRNSQNSIPQYLPKTPNFLSDDGTVEFVLQLSNFSHNNGGIWQSLTLGTDQAIVSISLFRTAFDLFLLGAIFIMGLYHLGLFALRHKDRSPLFFGVLCLLISFRLSIHGSTILSVAFPNIPWEFLVKLDYFVLYFGMIFFSAFLQSLYSQEFSRKVLNLITLLAIGFVVFTIIVPASIFTAYLVYFQGIMGLSCLYYLYVMIRASLAKREGASVVLGGCVILIASFVNDVLYNHEIIHTADLVGAGLFMMIFSQSFVLSLRFSKAFFTVEELSTNLEEQVKERTAAIRDLLDNTGQGFFSFAKDYIVQRYTSKAVREFFGRPIEHENALVLMFSDASQQRQEALDLVFNQDGNLEMIAPLLPSEMEKDGKVYKTDYHWIPAQNRLAGRIMIVLTDITAQRDLELQLKEDEERNRMIVKIAVDRHGFLSFLNEINRCVKEVKDILKLPVSEIKPDQLFRHCHTIKGGLASYLFNKGSEKAHLMESKLESVRSGQDQINDVLVDTLNRDTEELESILQQTLNGLEQVVPRELIEASGQNYYRIPETKISVVEKALAKSSYSDPDLMGAIHDLRRQPVRNILKKFGEDAKELGDRLNKPLNVLLKGEETELIHDSFNPFFTSLVHLIRNAVDHGIEDPEIRTMLGKPEIGELTINASIEGDNFILKVADDGGGIDPSVVKGKAVEKGLISQQQAEALSDQEAVQLVFKPGFSTNEAVSELSGRGVGMDAVAGEVNALQGTIDISSKIDMGTTFTITLPLS
jgi:signal transduction histidine kinase